MADIGIVSNTTTHLIPDKGEPLCNSDDLMLLVRHLHGDGTLDCSLISTQNDYFKVMRQDDVEFLNLLKEDYYDPSIHNTFYTVHATCNSWMLLTCLDNPDDFLWNPTTGKRIGLPHFALACPAFSDHWAYGLRFDPAGDTCKVLRARETYKYTLDEELYVELLSSASNSWKRILCPHGRCIHPDQESSLYINGFYYWPTGAGTILSFDFAEERFGPLIPKPKSDKFPNATAHLVEYDASLAAVVFEYGKWLKNNRVNSIPPPAERKSFVFEIWVWRKEAAKWSCVFTGEIPASDASVDRVLGLYKNSKLLLEGLYGDLLLYDLETARVENLGIRDEGMDLMVFPYVANAEPNYISFLKVISSASTCTVAGVPVTIRALTRGLKPNDCLMLMVHCVLDQTRIHYVISMENNSFKVLQDDDNRLPNLSRLKAENFDLDCNNAKYHVVASCNTWMLWIYNEIPSEPGVLLWDPRTDVLVTLPFFEVEPPMPHPVYEYVVAYGIGFDPSDPGDYKVVRCCVVEYFHSDDEAHAELFSLETWKKIPYPHDLEWKVFQNPSLFIDGFYYWAAKNSSKEDVAIISFDFAKEEFPPALIPMPSTKILWDITCDYVCITEFHGLLAAIVADYQGQDDTSMNINCPRQKQQKKMKTKKNIQKKKKKNIQKKMKKRAPFIFEIWVWKNGIWSHVSTHTVFRPTPAVFSRVIGLYKNDKVFLQDSERYLWLYNRETSELENLGIRDNGDIFSLAVYPYV